MTVVADPQIDPGPPIELAELAEPVGRALGSAGVTVLDFRVHALQGGYGAATGGVFRITGRASTAEGSEPSEWSLVLKVLRPAATGRSSEDPTAMGYWRREPLVYRSGLLDLLGPGLCAPRCFSAETRGEEEWLWLEALGDGGGSVTDAGFLVHAAMPASEATRARRERTFGIPHDEFLERIAQTSAFALDVADGVRPLL